MMIDYKSNSHREHFTYRELPSSKRYKVWWGVAGGSSGAYYSSNVNPSHIGMTLAWYLGSVGANKWGQFSGLTIPETNPGGGATVGFGFKTGYCNVTAQGGPATTTTGEHTTAYTSIDNYNSYTKHVVSGTIYAVNGKDGTNATLYDSRVAPGVSPGYSAYDGTIDGPGAGGYTPSGSSGVQYAGKNGLIKVTVVGD